MNYTVVTHTAPLGRLSWLDFCRNLLTGDLAASTTPCVVWYSARVFVTGKLLEKWKNLEIVSKMFLRPLQCEQISSSDPIIRTTRPKILMYCSKLSIDPDKINYGHLDY